MTAEDGGGFLQEQLDRHLEGALENALKATKTTVQAVPHPAGSILLLITATYNDFLP
ncbi:hypothetical protein JWG42_14180 [Desulfoprunum benzoelyticum]|uniref:Uncharacterized protein n=1 Tax=Desulfoprunum benzoelyticum TaxID=1506996 RepID=A0A840UUP3_9BACT|nr:hypothetical protein [Desulfoprunum benzoelyticum]MBB5348533.1 hypothetical protein [Desulfoprunum benzoelyticum]MBM9531304.1 hypothetical protein [Desulfoprunum benzoelyticum]